MGIFGDKKKKEKFNSTIKETKEKIEIIERPRICCIDLKEETILAMKHIGANIYEGTLGSKIKIPNKSMGDAYQVILKYEFPPNLHEFDIIVIDLNSYNTIEYKAEDHIRETHTGKSTSYLLSSYPETLFNPRPISGFILKNKLHKIINRKYLVIVFSSEDYKIKYEVFEITEGHASRRELENYDIYSFGDSVPKDEPIFGIEITVCNMRNDLQALLEKYKRGTFYNQTFYHPTYLKNDKSVKNERYFPLMNNMNGDIISYMEFSEYGNLIMLPQIKDKTSFLIEFLEKIAPSIYPELFPYSTAFKWKEEEDYWLPKHAELVEEKLNIQKEYETKLAEIDGKIKDNLKNYSFLHDIIIETGDALVKALIQYLKWLGFPSVKYCDELKSSSNILEEDVQVEFENVLLIIECKGIGGTSTDSDCSQISKIKHRRSKERNKFDVFALYIVNHQRYLPPLKRQNPPFSEEQIQDAKNDERGLLTTWQLFNLYFDIEKGIITKEEARKLLLDYGLVEFKPKDLINIYEPTRFFCDGEVCIVNIDNISLGIGDELLIEKNGKFEKAIILEIQENGQSVMQASKGELGLKLNTKVRKKSILW